MADPRPKVSLAIATLNSEKTLEKCLKSIKKQDYPQELIEILLIDGGSKDRTREIANSYGCKILENPKVEPASAKRIGICECKGDYLLFLDSDEELDNSQSISQKLTIKENHQPCAVISTGYRTPPEANDISHYLNEFGDPFSYFVYRQSIDHRFFISSLKRKYPVTHEDDLSVIFDFKESKTLPLLELGQFAALIDMRFLREKYKISTEEELDPFLLPHLFYILIKNNSRLAIAKNDSVVHYSSISKTAYKNKILWRVRNNLHHKEDISGQSGYLHRESFDTSSAHWRKFLYIPYVGLIIPLFLDTLRLMISRKSLLYRIHFSLSVFTLKSIVMEFLKHLFKKKPPMTSYGSDEVIRS